MSKMKSVGLRFSNILDRLSIKFSEMWFRYTSPHSKDIPEELSYLMRDGQNDICKYIPLPAQMGSSTVLERMRRGYMRGGVISGTSPQDTVSRSRNGISSVFIRGMLCFVQSASFTTTRTLTLRHSSFLQYHMVLTMVTKTCLGRSGPTMLGKVQTWINGESVGRAWTAYSYGNCKGCSYNGMYLPLKCQLGCRQPTRRWYTIKIWRI